MVNISIEWSGIRFRKMFHFYQSHQIMLVAAVISVLMWTLANCKIKIKSENFFPGQNMKFDPSDAHLEVLLSRKSLICPYQYFSWLFKVSTATIFVLIIIYDWFLLILDREFHMNFFCRSSHGNQKWSALHLVPKLNYVRWFRYQKSINFVLWSIQIFLKIQSFTMKITPFTTKILCKLSFTEVIKISI